MKFKMRISQMMKI